jgi:hypothetical protein
VDAANRALRPRARLDLFSVDTLIDMLARLWIRVRVAFSTSKRSVRVA